MLTTEFNGKQYIFDSDRLIVNGFPIPYNEMSGIAHRGGDQPAFVFDFKGRRFLLPYNPGEMKAILPYFLYARQFSTAPAPAPAPEPEPAPAPEPTPTPEPAPEPEVVYEPEVEPEPEFVPEPEPEVAYEPEVVPEPEPEVALPAEELPAEPPAKKKRTVLIIIIGLVVLAAAAAAFFIFGGDSEDVDPGESEAVSEEAADEEFEEFEDTEAAPATVEGTYEATDGFTVTDSDGTMDIKLNKVYTGDDALKKLSDLNEDQKTYTADLEPGYRLVLYEYQSTVKEGSMVGDTITGEMFMPDKETVFDDWWPNDLVNNTDKDLSYGDIEVAKGETATLYILYTMPEDMKEYYEMVYANTDDSAIWVHYVLE